MPLSGLCCEYPSVHTLRSPWTRLSLDDPALHNLVEKIDTMMKEFGHATILNVVPSIRQGFLKPYFSANPSSSFSTAQTEKNLLPKLGKQIGENI